MLPETEKHASLAFISSSFGLGRIGGVHGASETLWENENRLLAFGCSPILRFDPMQLFISAWMPTRDYSKYRQSSPFCGSCIMITGSRLFVLLASLRMLLLLNHNIIFCEDSSCSADIACSSALFVLPYRLFIGFPAFIEPIFFLFR